MSEENNVKMKLEIPSYTRKFLEENGREPNAEEKRKTIDGLFYDITMDGCDVEPTSNGIRIHGGMVCAGQSIAEAEIEIIIPFKKVAKILSAQIDEMNDVAQLLKKME